MQVGWIWVKHGFAKSAPRLCARHAAVTFELPVLSTLSAQAGRVAQAFGEQIREG